MANFALNYSYSRNLAIPLDEDAVKPLSADVLTYVQTKSKCYPGQLFSVTGDTEENNGLYMALTVGPQGTIKKIDTKAEEVSLDGYVTDEELTAAKTEVYNSATSHADTAVETAKNEAVTTATGYTDEKITAIVGSDTGKTIRQIANEELAAQLIPEEASDSLDTLQEIAAWIQSHPEDAAAMNNDIAELSGKSHTHANRTALDTINEETIEAWNAAEPNVITSVTVNNAALPVSGKAVNIDLEDYATKAYVSEKVTEIVTGGEVELTGYAKITDVESAVSECLSDAKEYADSADSGVLASAKEYTDEAIASHEVDLSPVQDDIAELSGAVSSNTEAISSLNTKAHTHDNLTELNKIIDGKVAQWDAAQANVIEEVQVNGLKVEPADKKVNIDLSEYAKTTAVTSAISDAYSSGTTYTDNAIREVNDGISEIGSEIAELSGNSHTHENSGVLETITSEKVAKWDSALDDAKSYTDTKVSEATTGLTTDITDLKESAHTHDNLTELNKIVGGKVEQWDAAQANVIESVKVDGVALEVGEDKSVNVVLTDYAKATAVTEEISTAVASAVEEAGNEADGKISAIVGSDTGKTIRQIANEELAAQLIPEEASDSLDTLQEIAAWIQAHPEDAAAMNKEIADLKESAHNHTNLTELDKISDGKVAQWDAAEPNVITAITVNGSGLAVSEKSVNVDLTAYATSEGVSSAISEAIESIPEVEPYTGGTAIDITSNGVSVKIAEADDTNKNFITVNDSNEMTVSGVTLDAAVTSKEILIEGGEWADSVITAFPEGKVPAGITLQSFLESMLCVEKFVSSVAQTTAFTVSCGNINPGLNKSGIVEVGTPVTLNAATANNTTASQSLTVKTFTYGYKLGEEGVHNTATAYTETLTPELTESKKTLRETFTGFVDAVADGTPISEKTGENSLDAVNMYAMEGNNSVTVYQTGDTYQTSTAVTAGTLYIATNLKNYYKSDKLTPNTFTPTFPQTSSTATDSTTYSVTGAHKYFVGDITDYSATYWDEDRSSVVRGLSKQDWATASTITAEYTFKTGTRQQTVVVPAKYSSVSGKDVNNGDVTFNLMKTFDFTNAQGFVSSYKAFVAPAPDGLGADSKITITIK